MASKWAELTPDAADHLGKMEPAGEEDGKAFSFGRIGNRPQLMVAFERAGGDGDEFAYAHLYRVEFEGQGTLVLHFSDHTVTVEGRNLRKLRKYLRDHKASEVREAGRDFADERETVVDRITVRPAKGA